MKNKNELRRRMFFLKKKHFFSGLKGIEGLCNHRHIGDVMSQCVGSIGNSSAVDVHDRR